MARRSAASAGLAALTAACIGACDPAHVVERDPAWRDGPSCGDGVVDEGEACDLGFANRADGACRECRLPACGDGVRDPGEVCDDGDSDDADACRSDCTPTLSEQWTRRWRGGPTAESVSDLVVDGGGDVIAVGWRDAGADGQVRPSVTRYAPTGDVRWSVAPGDIGAAHAIAQQSDGDLVVAVTRAPQPDMPGAVHVLRLALADGRVVLDVAPVDETGQAAAIATRDDAVFVAYNPQEGTGRVVALDAAGGVAASYAGTDVPLSVLHAIVALPDGDLVVGGGNAEGSRGVLARVTADGEPRFSVDDFDGPVIDVVADGADGVVAAITSVVDAVEPAAPWTWTTAVLVVALSGEGAERWSNRLAPTRGRREPGALAWASDRVVVVGADPLPTATCAPYHCEQVPWVAALDAQDGALRWEIVLDLGAQGRAHAVGIRDGSVLVGGQVRELFTSPAGFVSRREEAAP